MKVTKKTVTLHQPVLEQLAKYYKKGYSMSSLIRKLLAKELKRKEREADE